MTLLKFDEVKKTWKEISKDSQKKLSPNFEFEIHKKLFERFHPGSCYYYIFNVFEAKMEFVSSEITSVIGYRPEDFSPDLDLLIQIIHPEDQDRFLLYEQNVTNFFTQLAPNKILNYKVSYDYRIRCINNSYKWILQQVSTIQGSEEGGVIRVLGVHTDISLFKTDNKPLGLSFIGLNGEPSYFNVLSPNDNSTVYHSLTKREKEILALLSVGKSSMAIANELFISKQTVATHRKNIIRKLKVKSFAELLRFALAFDL